MRYGHRRLRHRRTRVRHRTSSSHIIDLVLLRVILERNKAVAVVVFLARANKGRTLPPVVPESSYDGGSGQRYERGLLSPGRPLSERLGAELQLQELESVVQDHPRNVQKNKSRSASSKEVGSLPQAPPAPADHLSYDLTEGDYFPSYFEAGPSGVSNIACEGGRSLSLPQDIVNHHISTYHDQQRSVRLPIAPRVRGAWHWFSAAWMCG